MEGRGKARRKVVSVLEGHAHWPPPIWMMRQAGRYLPEYRATRAKANGFLDLCYTPDLAVEVTLQPIRRFGFDAAILFSDILVVPHALGRDLAFEEGRGPVMTPIGVDGIARLGMDGFHERLEPVYETVRRLRAALAEETTLIGFCGAPWTVATYMIAGHGSPDQAAAKMFALRQPDAMAALLDHLADVSADYLARQAAAGADVLQVFDSWAGVLDDGLFEAMCVRPMARLMARLRGLGVTVPVIGFPRGAGERALGYKALTGVDAIGLDWTATLATARAIQATGTAVQGNLDPMRLIAGGKALADGIRAILDGLAGGPLVFNLGHGVTPDTPVAHVEAMVAMVKGG